MELFPKLTLMVLWWNGWCATVSSPTWSKSLTMVTNMVSFFYSVPRIDIMMHKTIPQHPHYFTAQHHHHRIFRQQQKHHYGGSVRYRLENASSPSSSSSAASSASSALGNSYEMDETVEIKQHQPSVHAHHSLTKPHKKRHLNQQHHQHHSRVANSAESEEDFSAAASSGSLEERKLWFRMAMAWAV